MTFRLPVLILLVLGLYTENPAFGADSNSSRPLSPVERAALFPSEKTLNEGEAIVAANCASCHGMDGVSGEPGQPHLASQRTTYLYRELQAYQAGIRTDESMRQAVNYLADDFLLKSAIYYSSLDAPPPAEAGDESWLQHDDPLASARSATAGCGSCHGATGNSKIPGMPSLTGQHPEYFVAAMKAYQGGDRSHNLMQMLTKTLDDSALSEMGRFYALQAPEASPFANQTDESAGRKLTAPCASCHGADGNASAAEMPSLAGQDPTYLVMTMKMYMDGRRGHEAMSSAMATYESAEIDAMAAFYAAQKPITRRVRAPLNTSEWLTRCQRCHGKNGISTDPRYPSLAGQDEAYLLQAMQAYSEGERANSIMGAMTEPLNDRDMERLAKYFAARQNKSVIYVDLPCNEK